MDRERFEPRAEVIDLDDATSVGCGPRIAKKMLILGVYADSKVLTFTKRPAENHLLAFNSERSDDESILIQASIPHPGEGSGFPPEVHPIDEMQVQVFLWAGLDPDRPEGSGAFEVRYVGEELTQVRRTLTVTAIPDGYELAFGEERPE